MNHILRQLLAFTLALLTLLPFLRRAYRRGELGRLGDWWHRASRLARALAIAFVLTAVAYGSDKLLGGHIDEGLRLIGEYCVRGRTSRFCIDISDNSRLPDDRIRWSASNSGAVAFSNSCGRIVGVTPTSLGPNTLFVDIDGYDGPRPCITYRCVDETITKLSVWILGTNSVYLTTPTDVSNMVAQVNEVYEQVGMRFVIDTITMMPYDGKKLVLDPLSDNYLDTVSNICNIATGTGGLELYFVYSLGESWGGNYGPLGQSFGIVLEADAGALVLAHEIGHSCGLQDIYYQTEEIPALTGDLEHDGMAGDWGSESVAEHYYSPVTTQREIIQGLLMHGVRETADVDLSCGDIHGIWITDDENEPSYSISNAPVGFFQHGIRQPENQ